MLTLEQIEKRKQGIGSTESAIIMGLNQNISPYQLWLIKTGQVQPDDLSNVPQVQWGIIHEESIAQYYANLMNCRVRRMNETLFHKEHSFLLCHIDRKIEGLKKLVECKFAMFARDDWGPSGSDIVPLPYIVQVQHQLAITGYEEADLAALIGGWDFRLYHFKRDEQLIERIIKEATQFWKCVETKTPPALRDRVDASLAYPFSNGNFKEAEPEIVSTIEKFRMLRLQTKQLDDEKEKLSDELTLFLKDAEGLKVQDQVLATWKARKDGVRVLKVMEAKI